MHANFSPFHETAVSGCFYFSLYNLISLSSPFLIIIVFVWYSFFETIIVISGQLNKPPEICRISKYPFSSEF
jgi:hypothetical protein